MTQDLIVRQSAARDLPKPVATSGGPDGAAGSAPSEPSPEVGPPNPRLRVDSDLGVLVIEFRDAAGKVSASLPSHRKLEAYRAAVLYGIGLPSFLSPIGAVLYGIGLPSFLSPIGYSAEAYLKASPALPALKESPIPRAEQVSPGNAEGRGLDRVA